MSENYNFRNPENGEVSDMFSRVKNRREQMMKYKLLKDLLEGKTVDLRNSNILFEALNREKMEFESILELHPDQAREAMLAAKEDRECVDENIWWNRHSQSKMGLLGHIPPCVYYSRPAEYWSNSKLIKNFFNTFTKFRISTKKV